MGTNNDRFSRLRTSGLVYDEAQIALSGAISRCRTLVFNEYRNSSTPFLRWRPGVLRCYRDKIGPLVFPYGPRDWFSMRTIFGRVVFEFGSSNLTTAFQRHWAFTSLMKKLSEVPLRVYSLTRVFGDNCKMAGFDGKDTAHAL